MSNLPTISTGTATFCLIMNKPFDICHECQQHTDLTRKFKPFLPTNDSRFLWLKYQVLLYFEVWLKTTEVRPGVCEKSEKQKMFISSQICKECIKINLHIHRTGIYSFRFCIKFQMWLKDLAKIH